MTSLLTIAQAQALGVGLELSDADLQAVIDREEAILIAMFGAHYSAITPISETVYGGDRSLYLKRKISSVTSITEYLYPGDTAPTTLVAADYYVWGNEGRIERTIYGTTAASHWGKVVTVVYTPVDDSDARRAALIRLVQIATEAGASASGGSVSGLGFSVSGSTSAAAIGRRNDVYASLGWLSR